MTKRYDRAYFEKWYRSRTHRVHDPGEVRRKVALAIATAEYFLRRPIESVLDVGCGEGAWFKYLRTMRRNTRYSGIDPSAYVVERFGTERNISKGSVAELRSYSGHYDLVVCSDVLHYVADAEVKRGATHLQRLTGGMAFLEVLTAEDEIIGDIDGLIRRPAQWYREVFGNAGFVQAGAYCWLSDSLRDDAAELELPSS
ncbi:MAG TPA: class I SAM-dependent methyltransferase [Thermoanaerobaculia bacterium]|nr:class I SAM-dependent methyltransferase [Thermoanaerobaculia bacterium]